MKQKKFWGILVAAVIAVTVLTAGCSGNGGETAGQTSREETIAETVKETTTAAETAKETTMEAASETGQTKEYKLPEKVILGALGTHPPYNYMEDDKLGGYEVDIWNEIAKRNGFELNIRRLSSVDYLGCWRLERLIRFFLKLQLLMREKKSMTLQHRICIIREAG